MILLRTSLVSTIALLFSWTFAAQVARAQKQESRKLVFVCEHGTVKSVVAVEHFNRLARARGLNIEAISRGTRPDSTVPGPVNQGLAGDGFDVSRFRARPLTADDLTSAVLVVTLDADVNAIVGTTVRTDHWDGLPSVLSNYANGRAAIVTRVERLVDSLVKAKGTRAPE